MDFIKTSFWKGSQYRNKKFATQEIFEEWLKKTTKYKIDLEDKGQDFLTWWIDEKGEILHSFPFQSDIWNGGMLDINSLKKGLKPLFQDGRELLYKIVDIIKTGD
jgi:hypothetical protein